jgi:hypothetical protein
MEKLKKELECAFGRRHLKITEYSSYDLNVSKTGTSG